MLGIQIDSHQKFHEHTTAVTKKANRLLSKYFRFFDKATFINLYKTFIRPVLEYGSIIWGPLFVLDQQQVQKVQKRATRLVHDLRDRTYNNHLVEVNLPLLKYRRHRGDMIIIYQLLQP